MKVDIKLLSISELNALYRFVSSKPFNSNEQAKKIIKERLAEIEDELMNRAFGLNPYKSDKNVLPQVEKGVVVVKYEGENPMTVLHKNVSKEISVNTHNLPSQMGGINTTTDGK